jgi:hypothetical protein
MGREAASCAQGQSANVSRPLVLGQILDVNVDGFQLGIFAIKL